MKRPNRRCYSFGSFYLDPRERVLRRQREVVPLTPKCFDIPLLLVENNGHLVTKDELMTGVWPDPFVEEGKLSYNMSMLRKTLGKTPNRGEFIETVPRCGFRSVAAVNEVAAEDAGIGTEESISVREFEARGERAARESRLRGHSSQREVRACAWCNLTGFQILCGTAGRYRISHRHRQT